MRLELEAGAAIVVDTAVASGTRLNTSSFLSLSSPPLSQSALLPTLRFLTPRFYSFTFGEKKDVFPIAPGVLQVWQCRPLCW